MSNDMRWRWNGDTVQEAAGKGRYVEMKFWFLCTIDWDHTVGK